MVNFESIDELYGSFRETCGSPPGIGIFDKRVLMPMDWLVEQVAAETGEKVTPEKLERYAAEGLFPLLQRDGNTGDLGFPMYVPSRIGLFAQLERQGWTTGELRRVAEAIIDFSLTDDEMAYEEDDAKLVASNVEQDIARDEEFLTYLEADQRPSGPPPRWEPNATPAQVRERLRAARAYMGHLRSEQLSPAGLETLARISFRIRTRDESIRVMCLESDRAVVRAGFSPWIVFRQERWDEHLAFSFDGIDWYWTLREPSADVDEGSGSVPIRLPGVILKDCRLTLISVTTPGEYDRVWRRYELEDYFHARAKLREERIRPHCLKQLPDGKRVYCSKTCRDAAKMKRFRQNSPDKVIRINERYWSDAKE